MRRLCYIFAGLALGTILWFVATHKWTTVTPAYEVHEAMDIFKAAQTWALDRGGEFPPDLEFLNSGGHMEVDYADRLQAKVIEYRGKGMRLTDDGKQLLLRYRAGKDKEVRVNLDGSGKSVLTSTPLPP